MKYTKTAFSFLIAVAVIAMAPQAVLALTVSENGTGAGTVTAPTTQDNGSGSGAVTAPTTQTNGTGAGNVTTPATQTNGTGAGTVTAPTTQTNGTGAGTVTAPATQTNGTGAGTVTPPATNNNGTGGGTTVTPPAAVSGGGSGYVSGGNYTGGGATLPVLVNVSDCNYLTTFMRIEKNNPASEVIKLQNFLNTYEGAQIGVTGVFDIATLAAVNAFQAKYVADIMFPWGATTPSGQVYITTTKKINEIFCKKNFSLTPAQIAEIEAYRTGVRNDTTVDGDLGTVGTPTGTVSPSPSTNVGDTQVGAIAKTSVFSKVWGFIKWIFGR